MTTEIEERLDEIRERGLYRKLRCVSGPQGPRVLLDGRPVLLLCSNNYLGLADHPRVREAAVHGYATAFWVAAGFAVAALVATLVWLRRGGLRPAAPAGRETGRPGGAKTAGGAAGRPAPAAAAGPAPDLRRRRQSAGGGGGQGGASPRRQRGRRGDRGRGDAEPRRAAKLRPRRRRQLAVGRGRPRDRLRLRRPHDEPRRLRHGEETPRGDDSRRRLRPAGPASACGAAAAVIVGSVVVIVSEAKSDSERAGPRHPGGRAGQRSRDTV